jgi:hypothetical protein
MKHNILTSLGLVTLLCVGAENALAVTVEALPTYDSRAQAGNIVDGNSNQKDPASSTSSATWFGTGAEFIQSDAMASGLSSQNSVVAKQSSFDLSATFNQSLSQTRLIIPVEVTAAGIGSLTFNWNGELNYFSDAPGSAQYIVQGTTANNPGQFVSGLPTNSASLSKSGFRQNSSNEDTLAFDETQTIRWVFQADDVGKIFDVSVFSQALVTFSNQKEALFAGNPFEPVANASIFANIDFGTDNVLAAVGVTAVPVPAAVWLFGSALVGLFGVRKRNAI